MDSDSLADRLSRIQTLWTLVRQAHDGPADAARAAQQRVLDRYGGAVRRYLRGAVRDPKAAEELFQEFACRFLQGDLKGADPDRGKFRRFVKGVLFHMVADHYRRKKRQPGPLGPDQPEPAEDAPSHDDLDRELRTSWRDELLAKSWAALEEVEKETGRPLYTVLRFRAENPKHPSIRLAAELSAKLGKPLNAGGVRQTLHRAREKFAELVLDEVVHSLEQPTADQVREELTELGLLEYCQPALERREDREPKE